MYGVSRDHLRNDLMKSPSTKFLVGILMTYGRHRLSYDDYSFLGNSFFFAFYVCIPLQKFLTSAHRLRNKA